MKFIYMYIYRHTLENSNNELNDQLADLSITTRSYENQIKSFKDKESSFQTSKEHSQDDDSLLNLSTYVGDVSTDICNINIRNNKNKNETNDIVDCEVNTPIAKMYKLIKEQELRIQVELYIYISIYIYEYI
jgi:hypothetical protein